MAELNIVTGPGEGGSGFDAQPKRTAASPLTGGRIYLRPLEDADIPVLAPFFADMKNTLYYIPTLLRRYSQEQVRELLADWHDQSQYFVYAICDRLTEKVLGLANLDGVNYVNGNTEIGIAVTDTDSQGQGYATEALELLIAYCFREMRLHRVYARIMAGNIPSRRLFEKLGFREEGVMRDQVRRNGGYMDMILVGLLEGDFKTGE